jgi:RNA-splicing ligase RtcB
MLHPGAFSFAHLQWTDVMTTHHNFDFLHAEGSTPIKGWVRGVPVDTQAQAQLRNIAAMPFVGPWVAVMPDVHVGKGATVGSVIPTRGAIIPAAVGVDIGCGMAAVHTTLRADDLQEYARENREAMMARVLAEMRQRLPKFQLEKLAVNCHHNYVQTETHGGEELLVARKGAVSARAGELGIIPGSMGTRSYIVRGKGNAESFHSCSHGAGRVLSRSAARQQITLAQHREATAHVECRKDAEVIDESPAAYKSIDAVMAAQSDLVEVVHTLRQVVCIKG